MKSISQLLELQSNPYYKFSLEERAALDDFLSKKSEQSSQPKNNGKDSEKNIPATVINKNIVKKETGKIPTVDSSVEKHKTESEAVEDMVHADAVK